MALHIYNEPSHAGAEQLVNLIRGALGSNKKILWLLSGGSNVEVSLEVAQELRESGRGFLKAALIDERYGEPGHANSNYQKFVDAGFLDIGIPFEPVLQAGLGIAQAADAYESKLGSLCNEAAVVIAQLGIGADAHTAGVLPHSVGVSSERMVEHYDGPDFQRITMTLSALTKVDTAFVFAYGADKQDALEMLMAGEEDLAAVPCQILKHIPSVYLYNDQITGGAG